MPRCRIRVGPTGARHRSWAAEKSAFQSKNSCFPGWAPPCSGTADPFRAAALPLGKLIFRRPRNGRNARHPPESTRFAPCRNARWMACGVAEQATLAAVPLADGVTFAATLARCPGPSSAGGTGQRKARLLDPMGEFSQFSALPSAMGGRALTAFSLLFR